MATEELSPEAQARKTIDDLKAQIAEANKALKETLVRDRLVEYFAGQKVTNPFEVATRAVPAFSNVEPNIEKEELGAKAQAWFDEQRKLFAPDVSEGATQPVSAPAPAPQSPFSVVEPNLTSPGLPPKATPVVVGSKEYIEGGWSGKPMKDQIEAMRQGVLVSPEKVKVQQQSGTLLG